MLNARCVVFGIFATHCLGVVFLLVCSPVRTTSISEMFVSLPSEERVIAQAWLALPLTPALSVETLGVRWCLDVLLVVACQLTIFVTYRQSFATHFAAASVLFALIPLTGALHARDQPKRRLAVATVAMSLVGLACFGLALVVPSAERVDRRPLFVVGEWTMVVALAIKVYCGRADA